LQSQYALDDAPRLQLMYKEFGKTYAPAQVTEPDFLAAMKQILKVVYAIDEPQQSDYLRHIKQQLSGLA